MSDDDRRKLAVSGVPTRPLAVQRPSAPLIGELVGPYRLIRAIGAGGSARIDLARLERAYDFQRHVVIKRPLEHLRGDPQVAASLRREARIGGRLRHPNLVAVLDAGQHDGYDYLVLEYIHGCSLRTLMQTDKSGTVRDVPLSVAFSIAIDIARGLHDAHDLADDQGMPLGLVHRDVSPGNVLLGGDGAVKVADFGIAKETRVSTLSGTLHGTVTYMAPEQCRGHAFDRRADLFSVGVILWELVTHCRLFLADNDVASLHRVLSADVPRPRSIRHELSPALEELVMTALAHDPEKRFPTARSLADALEALAAEEGHIVGARRTARAVEEVIGARDVPWIASTTVAQVSAPSITPPPPRRSEGSLVAVIESLAVVPDAADSVPTFGPIDERGKGKEEGWVPSLPQLPTTDQVQPLPRRTRSRARLVWMAVGGVAIGAAAGVLSLTLGGEPKHTSGSTLPPPPTSSMTNPSQVTPPTTTATDVALPAPPPPTAGSSQAPTAPTIDSNAPPASPPTIETSHEPAAPLNQNAGTASSHRRHHVIASKVPPVVPITPPPPPEPVTSASTSTSSSTGSAVGSGSAGSVTPPAGSGKGSGSSVEWDPNMLLPPDSPHGSAGGSAHPSK